MAENVENLILEQLRQMRDEMRAMKTDMDSGFTRLEGRMDELEVGQGSLLGLVQALGHYMNVIDNRVEHIEEKLGIEE